MPAPLVLPAPSPPAPSTTQGSTFTFTQVHNDENLVFGLIFQHIFNEGEGVCVWQGSLIKLAIVHNEASFSLLLLEHNETVGCPL